MCIRNWGADQTEVRFGKIETALRILTGAVAPQLEKSVDDSLRSAVGDSTKAKESVEFAGDVIHQLRTSSIPMSTTGLKEASLNLENLVETKRNIPQVWSTAGEFITYRSQMIAGWELSNLPLCTTHSPESDISKLEESGHYITATMGPFKYRYCKIVIDSPDATAWLSPVLQMRDIILDHCAVFYNGGPIVVLPVKVATTMPAGPPGGKILFNTCTFTFSLPNTPHPDGQRLIKNLLASADNNTAFGAM